MVVDTATSKKILYNNSGANNQSSLAICIVVVAIECARAELRALLYLEISMSHFPGVAPATIQANFKNLSSFQDVCTLFNIHHSALRALLYEKKSYHDFEIHKKNGSKRKISAPTKNLKLIQLKLKEVLEGDYRPKRCVHGFVANKDIKSNALFHKRARVLLNVDLENFFPSINFARVYGLFRAKPFNFNSKVAATLANICCYEKKLPQGAPTSPIISNLICQKLDSNLIKLASQHGLVYTRYADDLSFSGTRSIKIDLELDKNEGNTFYKAVEKSINANGFKLNPKKSRVGYKNQARMSVTGITINHKMNVSRKMYRNIRAALNACRVHGVDKANAYYNEKFKLRMGRQERPSSQLLLALKGQIEYLGYVRDYDYLYSNLILQLWNIDKSIFSAKEYAKKIQPTREKHLALKNAAWVIEADGLYQGTAFLLKNHDFFITASHCVPLDSKEIIAYRPHLPDEKISMEVFKRSEKLDVLSLKAQKKIDNLVYLETVSDHEEVSILKDCIAVGFPNHNGKDHITINSCRISSFSHQFRNDYYCLNTGIITGMSGGPVLTNEYRVVGISVKGGASTEESASNLVMPITTAMSFLLES